MSIRRGLSIRRVIAGSRGAGGLEVGDRGRDGRKSSRFPRYISIVFVNFDADMPLKGTARTK